MATATVRILRSRDEWLEIAANWDEILQTLPDPTALQSYRFLSCWWERLGADKTLYIVLTELGGKPTGFLPLQMRQQRLWGKTYRIIEFIGMPDELDRPALVFPRQPDRFLSLALEALWESRADWDLLQLEEVVLEPRIAQLLKQFASGRGLLLRLHTFHPCPQLSLEQEWSDYYAGLSKKMRKNLRYLRGKLQKSGTLRYEIYRCAGDIQNGLDSYLKIESRSWKPIAGIGVSSSATYQSFYEHLLNNYAATGQARVIILWLDETPIAGTISIQENGIYYSLQITHDDAYSRYSPGTVLESMELEALMNENEFVTYEFLGGAMTNKQRWTSHRVETERLLIHQRDLRMLVFDWFYFRFKPRIKAMLQKAGAAPASWSTSG